MPYVWEVISVSKNGTVFHHRDFKSEKDAKKSRDAAAKRWSDEKWIIVKHDEKTS
jgi:hypothetical protein